MSLTIPSPKYRRLLALSALLALGACGGGSDDELSAETAADESRSEALAKRRTPPPPPPPPPSPPSPPVDSTVVGALALASSTAAGQARDGFAPCGISADGNLVAFVSPSASLVPGDTNGVDDVFLKNLKTGAVQRISTSATGAQLTDHSSCRQMTPDGRFVLLGGSSAQALVLKDVQTGAATPIYPAANSIPDNRGFSGGSMSDDATVIAFVTQPTQTYVGQYDYVNNIPARIMVRNLNTGTLTTLATDNGRTADGEIILGHLNARVSPDGQRVAFVSSASTLVAPDTTQSPDVFVRDLARGSTTLVTSSSNGAPMSGRTALYHVEWVNNAGTSERREAPVPESLSRRLAAHRTMALQAVLLHRTPLALALLAHVFVQRTFVDDYRRSCSVAQITPQLSAGALKSAADDLEGSTAWRAVEAARQDWAARIPEGLKERLVWLIELAQPELLELLALCTALTINALPGAGAAFEADAVADAVGLDMADWWEPTAASYLNHVPKSQIVQALKEASPGLADRGVEAMKKDPLVACAAARLAGKRWLPAPLRRPPTDARAAG